MHMWRVFVKAGLIGLTGTLFRGEFWTTSRANQVICLVDTGPGSGRDMLAFKRKFPNTTGRVILEDLPAVFNDVHYNDLGLEKIEYDVFTPQPIQGKSTEIVIGMKHLPCLLTHINRSSRLLPQIYLA